MLSARLQMVASFVSRGAILADIGSDHAYVPCALVNAGIIDKAYACEVKEGPLRSSRRTITQYQLENKVLAVLSDGLMNVPDDTNEIVIAGMGVHTILTILEAGLHRLSHFHRIIVQSNHGVELLREWISLHKYRILDEGIVFDEGKYYEVVVFDTEDGGYLSREEMYFGPCLFRRQDALLLSYYDERLATLREILAKLSPSHERYVFVQNEIALIAANRLRFGSKNK